MQTCTTHPDTGNKQQLIQGGMGMMKHGAPKTKIGKWLFEYSESCVLWMCIQGRNALRSFPDSGGTGEMDLQFHHAQISEPR